MEDIQSLKIQIKELNKRLNDAEAFKGHFLSNIRNAITNPFTSIVGLSREIIRSEKEEWKKVIVMASLIHNEAQDLDFQLNNIFCAAELESGEIFPEPNKTDIESIITRCVEKYNVKLKKKKINFSKEVLSEDFGMGNSRFVTDAKFFELILTNLLDNAVKFTESNGHISIRLIRGENDLKLTIRDSGKGIDQDLTNLVFNRFKRLNNNINSIEVGHGLGLSIVKVLIELLDGNIEFRSEIENGTEFTITIPEIETGENEIEGISSQGNEFLFLDSEVF